MSSYPLLDIFLSMLWFFLWVMWLFLVAWILVDIFRNHEIGGWAKAGWVVLVIFVPLIGVLVYLAVHGQDMRGIPESSSYRDDMPTMTRSNAEQLSSLADLHARGVLNDAEYANEKQKILH